MTLVEWQSDRLGIGASGMKNPIPGLTRFGGSRASLASTSSRDISNLVDDTSQAEQTHSTPRGTTNKMFPVGPAPSIYSQTLH